MSRKMYVIILTIIFVFTMNTFAVSEESTGTPGLIVKSNNGVLSVNGFDQFQWDFYIKNNSQQPIELRDLSLRYYFSNDGYNDLNRYILSSGTAVPSTYKNPSGAYEILRPLNYRFYGVDPINASADTFVEVFFTDLTTLETNGELYCYNTIRYISDFSNYAQFNLDNDYSFNPIRTIHLEDQLNTFDKIQVYHKGKLIWRIEPNVTPKSTPLSTSVPTPTNTPTPTIALNLVSGYIQPDVISAPVSLFSGFKVEIQGTNLWAVTDRNGFFELKGIPVSSSGYILKTSKPGYLTRIISNIMGQGNIVIGSSNQPISVWAGDIGAITEQDNAINMADIMQIIEYFNTSNGDGRYNLDVDLNEDNAVNIADIMIVVKHFNTTSSSYPQIY
ncbi:MAG: hypothetical protein N2645_16755 [Clostridia bacterium]|nr:hypothetical protein [Clostridia bacterium]